VAYIVQADIEARVSAQVLRQCLDDNNDATADVANVARLIADAESYVEGFLRKEYDLTAIRALGVACPNEIKRLCLDVATAYLVDRWPDYVRVDGTKLMDRARRDLMDLSAGKTRLDVVGSPEPAANNGGVVRSGNPDDTEVVPHIFIDSMGDF